MFLEFFSENPWIGCPSPSESFQKKKILKGEDGGQEDGGRVFEKRHWRLGIHPEQLNYATILPWNETGLNP
jgi:hypothetical protein